MTNHNPSITSSAASGSFSENANTTGSGALHNLSGTMNFTDKNKTDTHTTSASLKSAVLSSGSVIPATSLAQISSSMSSVIQSDNNGSGKLKWSFSAADSAFDFLSKNQTITLTYEIKLFDNHGGSTKKTVTVTVTGTDDKPVIDFGVSALVSEQANQTLSLSPDTVQVAVHFVDVDLTNTGHTASVTDVSASGATGGLLPGILGELVLRSFFHINNVVKPSGSSNGTINTTFSAPDLAFDYLADGETVDLTYTIKLNDNAGGITTQTVVITVVGANDAPKYLGGADTEHLAEGENLSPAGDLIASGGLLFADIDLSDGHTVSTSVTATRSGGGGVPLTEDQLLAALATAVSPDSTGQLFGEVEWSFALGNSSVSFLGLDETLTIAYTLTLTDDAGGTDTQTVTVTILGNGPGGPLIVNPLSATVSDTIAIDDGVLSFLGNVITDAGDSAGDLSTTLTVTDVNGNIGNVGAPISGAYGDLFIFADGTYFFIANGNIDLLPFGASDSEIYTFTVTDSLGRSETETLTLNFTGSNEAPSIVSAVASGSVTEDRGPSVLVNGNFETGDLTGWTASSPSISAEFLGLGGAFDDYTVRLAPGPTATLSQNIVTTTGLTYSLTFYVSGDPESTSNQFTASWDGMPVLTLTDNQVGGLTAYSFTVIGGAGPTTQLEFSYFNDGIAMYLDQIQVLPASGPATEEVDGSISFADLDTGDTHTATFVAQAGGYVGTFSLDPVAQGSGTGSTDWHFTVDNADIQFLAEGETLTQTYTVFVTDNHTDSATQDVTVTIIGTNDAPTTAVADTIITDADVNNGLAIPRWALGRNDIDPDASDTLSATNVGGAVGGSVLEFGAILFFDDASLGGSFTYEATDGIATSGPGTATVINSAVGSNLVGTSADEILISAIGNAASLDGGGGDDILIGNSGAHTLTGGDGDDIFAFQVVPDALNTITDFNENPSDHDMIAISASAFGSGLAAGMDTSPVFESSGDDQFFGSLFHYDTTNSVLYFSSDGTTASAIVVAQLQSGAMLSANDLMIV